MKVFKLIEHEIKDASVSDPYQELLAVIKIQGHLLLSDEQNRILGVISADELSLNSADTLTAFISSKPHLSPEQNIQEAYLLMKSLHLDCLPVFSDANFIGMVTLENVVERTFAIIAERQLLYQKVVHDLRNPVGNVIGLSGMLQENDPSEESSDMLRLLDASAKHVMEILNDLLFVELDENKPLKKEPTDLNSFYKSCVKEQLGLCVLKQIHVTENFCSEQYIKDIDRLQLKRAIQNVFSNAVKFSYPGATIEVSSLINNEKLILCIKDNGIGIPEQFKSEIFKRFTPVGRQGTNGEPTTGLGLCFSKECVDQHDGEIYFESAENKGAAFYIVL